MIRYILILGLFSVNAFASIISEWKYSQASNELAKGNYVQARDMMQSMLVNEPNRPDLLYDLGVASFKNKEFEQASAYFSCAAESEKCPLQLKEQAYFNLGNTSVELNQLNDAIVQYQKVLDLNEKNEQAKHNLEVVKKMLEEQNQKQQEKNDQGKDDQNQKDDKNNNQDSQDKNSQDGQDGDEGDGQGGSKDQKDDSSQDEKKDSQDSKDQKNKQEQNKNSKEKNDKQDDPSEQQNKDKKDAGDQSKDQKNEQNKKQPSDLNKDKSDKEQNKENKKGEKDTQKNDQKKNGDTGAGSPQIQQYKGPELAPEDQWILQVLNNCEKDEKKTSKQLIRASIEKQLGGQHDQHCW